MSDDLPLPPRSRFSRRFRAFAISLLAITLLVRLIWGWHFARQVSREQAHWKTAGLPIRLDEFPFQPLPVDQNAWLVQVQAAKLLSKVDSPRNGVSEYPPYPPFSPEWLADATASEQANAAALAKLRQARSVPRAQIHSEIPTTLKNVDRNLIAARGLANTACDSAMLMHLQHNDQQAIERLFDAMYHADSVCTSLLAVGQLVGIGLDALNVCVASEMAPAIRIGSQDSAHATREQVQQLIARLLDESLRQQSMHLSVLLEGQLTGHELEQFDGWLIAPLRDRALADWLRHTRLLSLAIRQKNLTVAKRVSPALPQKDLFDFGPLFGQPAQRKVPRYADWYALGNLSRLAETHFRIVADRRMAAVALAIRLYRLDHHDRWPSDLKQLVPAYLPALPLDPLQDDGRLIGYTTEPAQEGRPARPVLYVDPPGVTHAVAPSIPTYSWHNEVYEVYRVNGIGRQYRDLTRWTPPPELNSD